VQQKEKVWCKNGPEKIDTPFVFFPNGVNVMILKTLSPKRAHFNSKLVLCQDKNLA
jgi:hypothetical protein